MLAMGTTDEGGILGDCVERAATLGIARASQQIVILYNPPGSEVPVIKLVSTDRRGCGLDQTGRDQSVANFGTPFGNKFSVKSMAGSSGSEDESQGGSNVFL